MLQSFCPNVLNTTFGLFWWMIIGLSNSVCRWSFALFRGQHYLYLYLLAAVIAELSQSLLSIEMSLTGKLHSEVKVGHVISVT